MMSRRTLDPPGDHVSIAAYCAAHFGKSLWWNGSELFLAFYLTEHLRLTGVRAGIAIAAGLLIGAAFDIVVARRPLRFASVPRAGWLQLIGASTSILALALLAAALLAVDSARFAIVIAANIVFRLAYVFYDLPQNCLMSLIAWSPDERRQAAAARTAASATALLTMSALVAMNRPPADMAGAHGVLAGAAALIALVSAAWLWRETRRTPDVMPARSAVRGGGLVRPLVLMGVVSLTVPAFSKLTPYLTAYMRDGAASPLLLVIVAGATVLSQPVWLGILRRWDDARAAALAGALLIAAALAAVSLHLGVAAALVGAASGGLGTIIWAAFAIAVAGRNALLTAPAFAWLTATAKTALAIAAIGIGALLDATDYRRDGVGLLPTMTALILAGGCAVLLHAAIDLRSHRKRQTASA